MNNATLNVLYDYQIFYYQKYGGISRYFSNLIKTLHQNKMANVILPLYWSINEELKNIEFVTSKVNNRENIIRKMSIPIPNYIVMFYRKLFPKRNKEFLNQELTIKELCNGSINVFHPTYYEDYYLQYVKDIPLVITVHDMIHELFPQYYTQDQEMINKKRVVIERADHLIAISKSTKNDLCKIYNIEPDKVSVIYHANPFENLNKEIVEQSLLRLPNKYLLFVGSRYNYKNFRFFISVCTKILKQEKDLHIICTDKPFSKSEMLFFLKLGIYNRVRHISVKTDSEFVELYRKALAFVFPSLYEGFGFPILEAMSCGCPVILSNASSFPEVAGDAAIYFDPKDTESLQDAIMKIIKSESIREELRQKGYEREKEFSWKKVTKDTIEVYKKAIENKKASK